LVERNVVSLDAQEKRLTGAGAKGPDKLVEPDSCHPLSGHFVGQEYGGWQEYELDIDDLLQRCPPGHELLSDQSISKEPTMPSPVKPELLSPRSTTIESAFFYAKILIGYASCHALECSLVPFTLIVLAAVASADTIELDERPAGPSDWGYRPADDAVSASNPPSFSWRPQSKISSWEVRCQPASGSDGTEYRQDGIRWNVHCPSRLFDPGQYRWQYRGHRDDGQPTQWSQERTFSIRKDAAAMPMPGREELLGRIPSKHPRLFLRPDALPGLRKLAQGELKPQYKALVAQCDRLLKNPPPTKEPPKYGDIKRKSEEWRKIWWGNREYTVRALGGAATLAFARLLDGRQEYGQLAKRLLLECAAWDPKGATGYRYNDEAGMPYAYYFSRAYTFVNDLLTEEERDLCRKVMKVRGDEMYRHLCPRHFWSPYGSHRNRAWHFLGEVGIAFQREVEGADDWIWFAMNVFYNAYPVWSDDDGGWHEGSAYWSSYISRFTWWADVMRTAFDVNAYDKPFFSKVGYYPMYLMPPGKRGGGFGDQTARRTSTSNTPLMSILAAQAANPYWQWYVEQTGGPRQTSSYVGFMRGALPKVNAKVPTDLPASRCFYGTGQAYLNSNLLDAGGGVQIAFKSSPFGTQSHGYESNNSFLLSAYGERLLIRTGRRDIYGSSHHVDWMWSTRSVNNITVDGHGQKAHSSAARGRIVGFHAGESIDIVVGEAGDTYFGEKTQSNPDGRLLDRYTRSIVFVKPDLIVVYDRLVARQASAFEYWLHAVTEFAVESQDDIRLQVGNVACRIRMIQPRELSLSQTNQYDPNPRERVALREWHLTAKTKEKSRSVEFITLIWPHRKGKKPPHNVELDSLDGGYSLSAKLRDGSVTMLLPTDDAAELSEDGLKTKGRVALQRFAKDGTVLETACP